MLSLGFVGDYNANHTLGFALLDDDRTVRTLAENGIRTVWTRAGNEAERKELGAILRLNAARLSQDAVGRATKLIERARGSPKPGINWPWARPPSDDDRVDSRLPSDA